MAEPAKFTLGEATARPRAGMGLVVVDMQHQWCSPGVGMHEGVDQNVYFFGRIEGVCKGIRQLQDCFRQQGNEVMFVTIGSVTKDGREMSADFKKGGNLMHLTSEQHEAAILDCIAPQEDEIIIEKSSTSVFNSTNIDYLLRNLGKSCLILCGVMTNYCVESAARDAADKGYFVIVIEDCCAASSAQEHDAAITVLSGYSNVRIMSSVQLLSEMVQLKGGGASPSGFHEQLLESEAAQGSRAGLLLAAAAAAGFCALVSAALRPA
jgi:nicotinamidase-related amidase